MPTTSSITTGGKPASAPADALFDESLFEDGAGSDSASLLDLEDEGDGQISEADLQAMLAEGADTGETSVVVTADASAESVFPVGEGGVPEAGGDEDEEVDEEAILRIYSADCLRCVALVGALGQKVFKRCHYTAGNEDCPAGSARIVVGVPVNKIVSMILDAENSSDNARLARIYSQLSGKDQVVQDLVRDELAKARQALG